MEGTWKGRAKSLQITLEKPEPTRLVLSLFIGSVFFLWEPGKYLQNKKVTQVLGSSVLLRATLWDWMVQSFNSSQEYTVRMVSPPPPTHGRPSCLYKCSHHFSTFIEYLLCTRNCIYCGPISKERGASEGYIPWRRRLTSRCHPCGSTIMFTFYR